MQCLNYPRSKGYAFDLGKQTEKEYIKLMFALAYFSHSAF